MPYDLTNSPTAPPLRMAGPPTPAGWLTLLLMLVMSLLLDVLVVGATLLPVLAVVVRGLFTGRGLLCWRLDEDGLLAALRLTAKEAGSLFLDCMQEHTRTWINHQIILTLK